MTTRMITILAPPKILREFRSAVKLLGIQYRQAFTWLAGPDPGATIRAASGVRVDWSGPLEKMTMWVSADLHAALAADPRPNGRAAGSILAAVAGRIEDTLLKILRGSRR